MVKVHPVGTFAPSAFCFLLERSNVTEFADSQYSSTLVIPVLFPRADSESRSDSRFRRSNSFE